MKKALLLWGRLPTCGPIFNRSIRAQHGQVFSRACRHHKTLWNRHAQHADLLRLAGHLDEEMRSKT